jgi:transcription-repair coupling factor (superfamily II helicase)
MRDLELRGAGNLLGAEQSGHIVGVGFELYCQLLRQSVARLKGDKTAAAIRANVKLDFVFVGEGTPRRRPPQPGRPRGRLHGDQGRRGQGGGPASAGSRRGSPRPTSARPASDRFLPAAGDGRLRAGRAPDRGGAQGPIRKAGPEVRTLLLVTEIRVLAEQKGIFPSNRNRTA